MKVSEAIQWGRVQLEGAGVERAIVDSRLLLAHALGKNTADLLMKDEDQVSVAQQENFEKFISRRMDREPYAYIVGEREFYGLKLSVSPDVLIPRPETESLVETFLEKIDVLKIESARVVDLGTGSGAIALALASKLSDRFEILGIDFSLRALEIAEANRKKFGFRNLSFRQLDYISNFSQLIDISQSTAELPVLWIANPPYIPRIAFAQLEPEIKDFEPQEALDGGLEGLDFYRSILETYGKIFPRPRILALETMGPWQIEKIRGLIGQNKGIFTEGPIMMIDSQESF